MTVTYSVRPLPLGHLVLRGNHAFRNHDPEGAYPYTLYSWLLQGSDGTFHLVDTGPEDVAELNRGLGDMCVEPVRASAAETLPAHLKRLRVDPDRVETLLFTHMHYDHCTNIQLFPNAKLVVNRSGFEEAIRRLSHQGPWIPGQVIFPLRDEWQDRCILAGDDEEIREGLSVFRCGGHTPDSQAIVVNTRKGRAIITGDVVSLYENMERGEPIGVAENFEEILAAMERIRKEADIFLPSHDPKVMEKYPEGLE